MVKDITIQEIVAGAYDPQTQTHTAGTNLSYTAKTVPDVLLARDLPAGIESNTAGGDLQRGDVLVYIRSNEADFTPTMEHQAIYEGATWNIHQVSDIGGIVFELHLRRLQ